MKFIQSSFILLLGLLVFTNSACNDPTVIGSDLLEDDQLDIAFTDTLSINAFTQPIDSIVTYNPNTSINIESFPLGNFNDPIFGRISSSVYFQVTLNVNFPDFDDDALKLDSVVLILPYDTENSYGNFDESHSLEVYQMNDVFPDTLLQSNLSYPADRLIASLTFNPSPDDSVSVFSPKDDTLVNQPPHLRIKIDQDNFHKELFNLDSLRSNSVPDFEDFLKGLYLKPTSENNSIPGFQFRSSATGLKVYYHTDVDTVYSEYLFPIFSGNVVTAKFEHDLSTSQVNIADNYINENAPFSDSLLFLQGMSGPNIIVEIPYATSLEDIVVNKAELELPLFTFMEDQSQYSPIRKIVISEVQEDGTFRVVDDITFAINRVGTDRFTDLFGGEVEADNTYKLNISTHFQDMVRGLVTNKMVITAFPKAEQAVRSVIRGPRNTDGPLKLNLTYTNY